MNELVVDSIVAFSLIVFNSVLAAARSAFVNARRARLDQMAEAGEGGAELALRVATDSAPLIATVRLAQTVCRFLAAGVVTFVFAPHLARALSVWPALAGQATAIAVAVIAGGAGIVVVIWGELLPEALVLREPEAWAIRLAPLVALLEWLLAPLVRLAVWMSGLIAVPLGGRVPQIVTEEEIKTLVDAGEEGGVIEEEEKDMIYSIFQFADTLAREVMVPRIDMLALDGETPIKDAVEAVLSAGHSRVPVYADSIDNIVGLLYAKDLLRVWHEGGEPRPLRDLLRPAYFVPEAITLDKLLADLQQRRIHMAVVVDEYGGTAGLVTLEDIVEEIVGEIRDEYDTGEELPYQKVSEEEYIFDGGIDIDDVNDLLETHLPNDDADTLGGYIYGQLGRVPSMGDKVTRDELVMEVQSVAGRRIRKVRVQRLPPPAESEDEEAEK
ncbi:MAG TPA: hemolysin family protein [Anaerolineales bacterium]|nr:hemolysin family protein [Anaerolineales bacterium]